MLLRSSSTPVLGSLISYISDQSPNHHHFQPELANKHQPTTAVPQCLNKVSFNQGGSQSFTFSCNSSPISPSVSELSFGRCSSNVFRRAQSEGNLEGLVNASSDIDEFSFSKPVKRFAGRSSGSFLETIPSFSFHKSSGKYEDDSEYGEDDDEEDNLENQDQQLNDSIINGTENISFGFNEEMKYVNAYPNAGLQKESDENSQMYLARGLGISGVDMNFGGGNGSYGGYGGGNRSGDGDDKDVEKHYKKMVQDNPGNPLCLRNYAQFLYQTKHDLQGAEEYYSRAILIDPKDGEILSQYAKLVWDLHNDKDRATGYFERAVQAASEDSHVHAAYASFLWETEDEDEDNDILNDSPILQPIVHRGPMASATA